MAYLMFALHYFNTTEFLEPVIIGLVFFLGFRIFRHSLEIVVPDEFYHG